MPITKKNIRIANSVKILGHEVRLQMLSILLATGENSATYLQKKLNLPQSAVSQHLNLLRTKGFITARRTGPEKWYSIKNDKARHYIEKILYR